MSLQCQLIFSCVISHQNLFLQVHSLVLIAIFFVGSHLKLEREPCRDKVVTDPVAGCHTSYSYNLLLVSMLTGSVIRISVVCWTLRREEQDLNVLKSSNILENCALLGYYAASSGNFLPTFRDNLSVPSSGFKNSKESL